MPVDYSPRIDGFLKRYHKSILLKGVQSYKSENLVAKKLDVVHFFSVNLSQKPYAK